MNRVMYVDDDADIREVAALSLELDPEFEVALCASGAEALARAAESPPDLILLDLMMPEMDGPSTLARLREHPGTAQVPVVFVTALHTHASEAGRFLALGAAGVIAKPFDPMALAAQARKHLSGVERARVVTAPQQARVRGVQ